MAARTTTKAAEAATEPDEYDFDNWSQEAEDDALRKLNDVKHIIVEGSFVGRFADGTIVKIPLTLSLATIDELQKDFASPVDQFKHLLKTFAGEDVAADLDKRGIIPVAIMTEKFFRALGRAQELAFPES